MPIPLTPQLLTDAFTAAGVDSDNVNAIVAGSVQLTQMLAAGGLSGDALATFLRRAALQVARQALTVAQTKAAADGQAALAEKQAESNILQQQINTIDAQLTATLTA